MLIPCKCNIFGAHLTTICILQNLIDIVLCFPIYLKIISYNYVHNYNLNYTTRKQTAWQNFWLLILHKTKSNEKVSQNKSRKSIVNGKRRVFANDTEQRFSTVLQMRHTQLTTTSAARRWTSVTGAMSISSGAALSLAWSLYKRPVNANLVAANLGTVQVFNCS